VLMVTTTVGMFDGVHSNTSHLWPAVPLHSEFVVSPTSFEHRFIDPSATGDAADNSPVGGWVEFLDTRWELDPGPSGVFVVSDDGAVASRGFGDFTTVTGFLLERADNRTFWHVSDWENVTDGEVGFLTAVDELTGAHTFWGDEGLGDFPVLVWVVEDNAG